jgi:hypothetical protein
MGGVVLSRLGWVLSTNNAPPVGSAPLSPFPSLTSRSVVVTDPFYLSSYRSFNVTAHPETITGSKGHPILFGRDWPYFDQRKWPITPDSTQIVDWYHACQHLAKAAQARYPDDDDKVHRWYRRHCANLYKGEIHKITRPLDDAGLTQQSHYFHTHKRRMQYHTYLEEGYPIGSGTVESGVKQFKGRLTGPGMRWSRQSAEEMLVIRGAVMGQTFDTLWNAA